MITDNLVIGNSVIKNVLLASAKREFLAKGFLEASLKKICDDAGVTTGAIYRRYKGKEELFSEVVKPVVELFKTLMQQGLAANQQRVAEDRLQDNWLEMPEILNNWIHKLYDQRDTVKILLAKSDGTVYSDFIHDFIEENFALSYHFMEDLAKAGKCQLKLTYWEYHILLTSYWTVLFEMIVHDFSLQEALNFAPKVIQFFAWDKFIIFDEQ